MAVNNKIAVIILNYNDYVSTINYANIINNYTFISKIIVVDNFSPNESFEKLKKLSNDKIDVIQTAGNYGYAYGNNFAIRYLEEKYDQYEYVCISNPDISIEEKTIKKIVKFLDQNKKYAMATAQMHDKDNNFHQLAGWKERWLKNDIIDSSVILQRIFNKAHEEKYDPSFFKTKVSTVDCIPGSFFIIRAKIFKKVNYFDEKTFLYYEEDILCKKIRNLKQKIAVLNDCYYIHYESVSVDKSLKSLKKFRIMQRSKKYYHLNYNHRLATPLSKIKIIFVDLGSLLHYIEVLQSKSKVLQFFTKVLLKIYYGIKEDFILFLLKILLLILNILLYPLFWLIRKSRTKKSVLYFSLVTWKWIKQRPHFVSLYLSNYFNVDYRYQTLYDKYMPIEKNKHVMNQIKKNKNFKIKPFKIFPANGRYIKLNNYWNLIRTSFWNYDKVIFTHPNQTDFMFYKILKLKKVEIYYECMDNYIGWEQNREGYTAKENKLVLESKKIIVSSQKLKQQILLKYNIKDSQVFVVRNGYDKKVFENYQKIKTPLNKPNITYIGTIDEWFDLKSIIAFAKNHPDINIEVVGPINSILDKQISKIKNSNIHFYGPIEHSLVPQYIEDSSVMIMPFKINEIIDFVDPVKIYEYLFMKKPIVSSYWDELKQFKGLVNFYENQTDFDEVVIKALKSNVKINEKYKNIIETADWQERLKEYIKIIR